MTFGDGRALSGQAHIAGDLRQTATHAVENMAMQLTSHELLQRVPQKARMQVCRISRCEHNVSAIAIAFDHVRTPARYDTALDAQTLIRHLESDQTWRLNGGDAL